MRPLMECQCQQSNLLTQGGDDLFLEPVKVSKKKYTISISIVTKAISFEAAEDAISDLISEAISRFGDGYQPEVDIKDYYIEDADTDPWSRQSPNHS